MHRDDDEQEEPRYEWHKLMPFVSGLQGRGRFATTTTTATTTTHLSLQRDSQYSVDDSAFD